MAVLGISSVNHLSYAMRELRVIVRHVSPVLEDLQSQINQRRC
jgi:hypothetical protein